MPTEDLSLRLRAQVRDFVRGLDVAAKAAERLRLDVIEMQKGVEGALSRLDASAKRTLGRVSKTFGGVGSGAKKATTETRQASRQLSRELGRTEKSASQAARGMERAAVRSQEGFQGAARGIRESVFSIRNALLSLGAGAAAQQTVKFAADFETSLANVSTLLTDTAVPIDRYRDQLLELSEASSKELLDLTQGLYQTISAGIPAVEGAGGAFDVLSAAQKASVAGLATTEEAVNALVTVFNAYQGEAGTAAEISDKLFRTVARGRTTFPQLASTLGTVVTSAASFGVSIDETLASIATLTGFGLSTEQAVTALNNAILKIVNPTKEAQAAFAEAGIEVGGAALKTKGLAAILQEVEEATGGSADALTKLFPDIRALRAAVVLTGRGAGRFREDLDELANSAGSTESAFEKISNTFNDTAAIFKSQLQATLVAAGERVLPQLRKVIVDLGDYLVANRDAIGEAFERVVGALVDIGRFVAGNADLLLGFIKAFFAVKLINGATSALTSFRARMVEVAAASAGAGDSFASGIQKATVRGRGLLKTFLRGIPLLGWAVVGFEVGNQLFDSIKGRFDARKQELVDNIDDLRKRLDAAANREGAKTFKELKALRRQADAGQVIQTVTTEARRSGRGTETKDVPRFESPRAFVERVGPQDAPAEAFAQLQRAGRDVTEPSFANLLAEIERVADEVDATDRAMGKVATASAAAAAGAKASADAEKQAAAAARERERALTALAGLQDDMQAGEFTARAAAIAAEEQRLAVARTRIDLDEGSRLDAIRLIEQEVDLEGQRLALERDRIEAAAAAREADLAAQVEATEAVTTRAQREQALADLRATLADETSARLQAAANESTQRLMDLRKPLLDSARDDARQVIEDVESDAGSAFDRFSASVSGGLAGLAAQAKAAMAEAKAGVQAGAGAGVDAAAAMAGAAGGAAGAAAAAGAGAALSSSVVPAAGGGNLILELVGALANLEDLLGNVVGILDGVSDLIDGGLNNIVDKLIGSIGRLLQTLLGSALIKMVANLVKSLIVELPYVLGKAIGKGVYDLVRFLGRILTAAGREVGGFFSDFGNEFVGNTTGNEGARIVANIVTAGLNELGRAIFGGGGGGRRRKSKQQKLNEDFDARFGAEPAPSASSRAPLPPPPPARRRHTGGMVRGAAANAVTAARMVAAGARRFAAGGMVMPADFAARQRIRQRLRGDEVPSVLQAGEGVLSRLGVAAVGGEGAVERANRGQDVGGGSTVNVTLGSSGGALGALVRALVDQVAVDVRSSTGTVRRSLDRTRNGPPLMTRYMRGRA